MINSWTIPANMTRLGT